MEQRDIIIVGSGPAGISTALSLSRIAPELRSEIVVLEKDVHPRHKLCGGGVTNYADELLRKLGLRSQIPSVFVHRVRIHTPFKDVELVRPALFRVVQRDAFDADHVKQARAMGIEIRENCKVVHLRRQNGRVEVATNRETFRAKVVVGADGANGVVRRTLIREPRSRVSRLVEVLVPANAQVTPEFCHNLATFDFRVMSDNIAGYCWSFPSLVQGRPFLNIGVFDSRIAGGAGPDLRQALSAYLRERRIDRAQVTFMAHPERWFAPDGTYAVPNVLLVGDAAGIEPWFGEGISVALAYGPVAARAIKQAFDTDCFDFADYRRLILKSRLGKLLRRNQLIARYFYSGNWSRFFRWLVSVGSLYLNFKSRFQAAPPELFSQSGERV